MSLAKRIKPISYLKANAAEVLLDLTETREPMLILSAVAIRANWLHSVSGNFDRSR